MYVCEASGLLDDDEKGDLSDLKASILIFFKSNVKIEKINVMCDAYYNWIG